MGCTASTTSPWNSSEGVHVCAKGSSSDYDEVKEAILCHYDIGEDTYHQRFVSAVHQEKESFSRFSARMGDLLDKWAKSYLTGKDWRELIGTDGCSVLYRTVSKHGSGTRNPRPWKIG